MSEWVLLHNVQVLLKPLQITPNKESALSEMLFHAPASHNYHNVVIASVLYEKYGGYIHTFPVTIMTNVGYKHRWSVLYSLFSLSKSLLSCIISGDDGFTSVRDCKMININNR